MKYKIRQQVVRFKVVKDELKNRQVSGIMIEGQFLSYGNSSQILNLVYNQNIILKNQSFPVELDLEKRTKI